MSLDSYIYDQAAREFEEEPYDELDEDFDDGLDYPEPEDGFDPDNLDGVF